MKALITGGRGFVGSYFLNHSTLSMDSCSLRDNPIENIDFTKFDTVIHLAALVHQMKDAPESEYYKINRDLTINVATQAKLAGVKHFIFFSTIKVYGEFTEGNNVITEDSVCDPKDAYGKSKLEAEKLLSNLEDENFTVSIIRIPLVYGPNVKGNLISLVKLVDKFPILPFGNINNKRNLVFVGNLLKYVEQIVLLKQGGVFLICDLTPISTTDLIRKIAKVFNKKRVLLPIPKLIQNLLLRTYPKLGIRLFGDLHLDNSKTRKKLGLDDTFEHGIEEMVEFYRSNNNQLTFKFHLVF